jgi:hypothetical protein
MTDHVNARNITPKPTLETEILVIREQLRGDLVGHAICQECIDYDNTNCPGAIDALVECGSFLPKRIASGFDCACGLHNHVDRGHTAKPRLLIEARLSLGIVMKDDKLLRLLHINEELIEICQWLNENQNNILASKIIPISDELTRLVLDLRVEKSWENPRS